MSERISETLARLQALLPHWVEHSEEHAEDFRKWAEQVQNAGEPHVAEHLMAAAQYLARVSEALRGALDHLGGAPVSPEHEHPGRPHAHG